MEEASKASIYSAGYSDKCGTYRSESKKPHRSIGFAFHSTIPDKRECSYLGPNHSWRFDLDTIINVFRHIPVQFLYPILNVVHCIYYKLYFYLLAIAHFCFSSDLKLSQAATKPLHQTLSSANAFQHESKRVIYIRHGESEWNVIFNRPWNSSTLLHAIHAIFKEFIAIPTCRSIFLDSPLSTTGVRQSLLLQKRICSIPAAANDYSTSSPLTLLKCLQTPSADTIVVTSNLKRSIQTALIASKERFLFCQEKLYVSSSLQEIGRNIDTLSLGELAHNSSDDIDTTSNCYKDSVSKYSGRKLSIERKKTKLNWSWNYGNKAVFGCAEARMKQFLKWMFTRREHIVIVYGHSLWLQEFCKQYLTPGVDHPVKNLKLHNCEVVSFVVGHHQGRYYIEPKSFLFL